MNGRVSNRTSGSQTAQTKAGLIIDPPYHNRDNRTAQFAIIDSYHQTPPGNFYRGVKDNGTRKEQWQGLDFSCRLLLFRDSGNSQP